MNILRSLAVVLTVASPVFASEVPPALMREASDLAPTVFIGTRTDDLSHVGIENVVLTDLAIGGDEEFLGTWLADQVSPAVAEEVLSSYAASSRLSTRIEVGGSTAFRLMKLDDYRLAGNHYDWRRLQHDHPDVHAVMSMSVPGLDSQGAYAVVRYEVATPAGVQFTDFHIFERDGAYSWRQRIGAGIPPAALLTSEVARPKRLESDGD